MKYNILRNILHAMIFGIAGAVASCTSEQEPPVLESGEELRFEVGKGAASRASLSTSSNLTKQPFMLFGDVYITGVFSQGLKVIFKGDKVYHKNNIWDYGKHTYWLMGQEHSFVAVHPADIQEIPQGISYADSKISFTYETPVNDYKKCTDILVATHRRKYTLDTPGAVKFEFQHILSRINIKPAMQESLMYEDEIERDKYPYNKDEYIEVHRIELYGLKTKADFTFASDPLPVGELQADAITGTCIVDDNSVKRIDLTFKDGENPKVTNNGESVNVFDDDNVLLLLPQDIGNDAYAVLYYTINGDHTENQYVRTITMPFGKGIDKWETGKSYTYSFSIEKVYTGQIKPGTLKWTVKDLNISDSDQDKWIGDDDPDAVIRQEFSIDDEINDEDYTE